MKVEIDNLKRLKTLADNYEGEKGVGVSKQHIIQLFKKHDVKPVEIDGTAFYDITKLPEEIKKRLKL